VDGQLHNTNLTYQLGTCPLPIHIHWCPHTSNVDLISYCEQPASYQFAFAASPPPSKSKHPFGNNIYGRACSPQASCNHLRYCYIFLFTYNLDFNNVSLLIFNEYLASETLMTTGTTTGHLKLITESHQQADICNRSHSFHQAHTHSQDS